MGCGRKVGYCQPMCKPKCKRRCIGTFTDTYRVYENCCYSVYKVCCHCGHEFDYRRHSACPYCGGQMDDPPQFGSRGFGRRFGGFGRFGGFRRFGGFFPFGLGFLPEFGEEEEEEDIF